MAEIVHAEIPQIFAGCVFEVIESNGISKDAVALITTSIETRGGVKWPAPQSNSPALTHIISTTIDFPAYNDAVDGYINVVRPAWVEQCISRQRTINTRQYSPDPRLYLSDVVVTCADDIPAGDKDAVFGGVIAAGGLISESLTKTTTHLVALTMNNVQCHYVQTKHQNCHIILPHWFDDCLKLGRKITPLPYTLPNPSILTRKVNDPIKWRSSREITGAATPDPDPNGLASDAGTTREFTVLRGKVIHLADDLNLAPHLRDTLTTILANGGATVARHGPSSSANVLVCRNRDGDLYQAASRAGLDVGNLSWLFYLINHNSYTSPTRRLLHYPVPIDGVPGFAGLSISVSNYTGDARIYLESLVRAAGGHFTRTLTQNNTHLITAHQTSEKCDAAREWDIHIVNHLWLEESYAKCKIQSLTNNRYTHFPAATNLGEVVGQTQIDREATEKHFYPTVNEQGGQLAPVAANKREMRPNPADNNTINTSNMDIDTPEKENNPSVTTGRRAAKERAAAKLRDQAPDIALFEKESKRVGGVIYGGRKVDDPDRTTSSPAKTSRKRNSNGDVVDPARRSTDIESDTERPAQPQNSAQKKAKVKSTTAEKSAPLKVLVTGYLPWANKPSKQDVDKSKLRALGISIVDAVGKHSILAAPKMLRTRKFVAGIAGATAVVDTQWLEACLAKGEALSWQDYALRDDEWEQKHGTTAADAMIQARTHRTRGGMLNGRTVFCTEGVHGGTDAYKEIICANTGRFMLWKGRETTLAPPDGDDSRLLFLISDESKASSGLWTKFAATAKTHGWEPRVVKGDWMLTVATCQDMDLWDESWLLYGDADSMDTDA